jgi:predicted transcriptional regulator YdeE
MQKYIQTNSLNVLGVCVNSFPAGIKKAFTGLMKKFGFEHAYYGISWCEGDTVKYYAMVSEAAVNEADRSGYEKLTIEAGEYIVETMHGWQSKTKKVKGVFQGLLGPNVPDKDRPCIEWYKSDDELLCMIKATARSNS